MRKTQPSKLKKQGQGRTQARSSPLHQDRAHAATLAAKIAARKGRTAAPADVRTVRTFKRGSDFDAPPVNLDPPDTDTIVARRMSKNSLANLQSGRRGPRSQGPTLTTADHAANYVKLRVSGVPAIDAVQLFAKGDENLTAKQWHTCADRWEHDPRVVAQWDEFRGGKSWPDLDADERTEIALDLHVAQCAYVLYTNNISDPFAPMKTIAYARDVIMEKLAADKNTGGGTFDVWLQSIAANANAALPPMFKAGATTVPADLLTPAKRES